jgi:hypothetical protein
MKFDANAVQVDCINNSGSSCYAQFVDLSMKTIGEKFTFSGSAEEKENTTEILFVGGGRLAHLPQIVPQVFPNLTSLWIQSMEIPIVKNNLFGSQFSKIERFLLKNDKIKMIEEEAFGHLTNLWQIDLERNDIQSLTGKVFEKNFKLKWINLGWNQLKMINPGTFKSLNQLEVVELEFKNECFDQTIGCWDCEAKIDHAKLNSDLQRCYGNHEKSLELLKEGENLLGT